MPAHEHIQPEQLKLLMTGKELVDEGYLTFSPDLKPSLINRGEMEDMSEMWARKERESRYGGETTPSTYESMEKHGYLEGAPTMRIQHAADGSRAVYDGHHRIASAAALEREGKRQIFFPIEHQEQINPEDWDDLFYGGSSRS